MIVTMKCKLMRKYGMRGKNTNKKRTSYEVRFGASSRNRTSDTRIFSPLLYRLSYRGSKESDAEGTRTLDLQRDRLAF